MSRGKRYETERQLNYQKVLAVVIAIAVIVMFIFIVKKSFKKEENKINYEQEFYSLYSTNKWGVIDQYGKEVIAPSYKEMIIIPEKKKDVFIVTYDVNEDGSEFKTKVLNSKNEEILTDFDKIQAIENIGKDDNLWYEKGILKVINDNKQGLIDLQGKELLPCEYDEITALRGIENSIIVKKDGKVGLVNNQGNIVIEPKYKEIKNLGKTYKEGYITIDENDKYGLVSATKKQLLENKYEKIEQNYLENYFIVKENGKRKLINSNGETIIEDEVDDIVSPTKDGWVFKKKNLYGVISIEKEIEIEPKYDYLEQVKEDSYIAKKGDKYGIINQLDEIKVPFEYAGIKYNEKADLFIAEDAEYKTKIFDSQYNMKAEGILSSINEEESYIRMRVQDDYKYYDFKGDEKENIEILKNNTLFLKKKDGKYGFVDKKGKVVVDYIYDDATEQNKYGFAGVKKDGLWGSIDKEGKEVIGPKYKLEDNLIIDFIGKWHLGKDLNMNYYCEK